MLGSTMWAKCIGELSDSEYPLRVQLDSLRPAEAIDETEIVLLGHLLPATSLEYAL
jgi:hypothetical protein